MVATLMAATLTIPYFKHPPAPQQMRKVKFWALAEVAAFEIGLDSTAIIPFLRVCTSASAQNSNS